MASTILSIDIIADAKKLGQGLKKSNQGVQSWGQKVAKVGKIGAAGILAVGAAIAAAGDAAFDFAMKSAKAANEDRKSQKLLAGQLKRSGKATKDQVKDSEKLITKLQLQTGVLDDDLRPALGTLVRSTGDVKKAQKLLKVSLDASVGSGKPLATVALAVGKAFNGSNTSLLKLMPSLKDSKKPIEDLAKAFEGVAAEQADPFTKLQAAMTEIQESIGTVFLPYFEEAATRIGEAVTAMLDPKTKEGKAFEDVKVAIDEVVESLLVFFDLKGDPGESTAVKGLRLAKKILKDIKGIIDFIKPFWDTVTGKTFENVANSFNQAKDLLVTRAFANRFENSRQADVAVMSLKLESGTLYGAELVKAVNKQLKLQGKKPLQ